MLDFADVVVAAFEIYVFDCDGEAGAFAEGAIDDAEGAAWEGVLVGGVVEGGRWARTA